MATALPISATRCSLAFEIDYFHLRSTRAVWEQQVVGFFGYSSCHQGTALQLVVELKKLGLDIRPWNTSLLKIPLRDALATALKECDYALFYLCGCDRRLKHGDSGFTATPRDNVVYEIGLFQGAFGCLEQQSHRVSLLYEEGSFNAKADLPTDWLGGNDFQLAADPIKRSDQMRKVFEHISSLEPRIVSPRFLVGKEDPAEGFMHSFPKALIKSFENAANDFVSKPWDSQTEQEYWTKLIADIATLNTGDRLYAFCGSKNYQNPLVKRYMVMNEELAANGVHVHRFYALRAGLSDDEKSLIKRHWSLSKSSTRSGGTFKVSILLEDVASRELANLGLSEECGIVLCIRGHEAKVYIHRRTPNGQGFVEYTSPVICDTVLAQFVKWANNESRVDRVETELKSWKGLTAWKYP